MQGNILLVCIIDQLDNERIIKEGYRLAEKEKLKLKVLNIQKGVQNKNIKEINLENLFALCRFLQVDMQVYWGDDFGEIAINFISRNKPNVLLINESPELTQSNFISSLHEAFPDMLITIV